MFNGYTSWTRCVSHCRVISCRVLLFQLRLSTQCTEDFQQCFILTCRIYLASFCLVWIKVKCQVPTLCPCLERFHFLFFLEMAFGGIAQILCWWTPFFSPQNRLKPSLQSVILHQFNNNQFSILLQHFVTWDLKSQWIDLDSDRVHCEGRQRSWGATVKWNELNLILIFFF